MEIRVLKYFVAVAEKGSFRQAAESLHLSPPGLSQQIAKFEKRLGAPLFDRANRQTTLTPSGEVLLPLAKRILAESAYTFDLLQKVSKGEAGTLRISFVYSAAFNVLAKVVSTIHEVLPDIELHFVEDITDHQLAKIREGQIDLGIIRGSVDARDLLSVPLLNESLELVVHETHHLANRESVLMEELSDESIIISPRNSARYLYDQVASLCYSAGFQLRPILTAVQFPTLIGLVAAKQGVSILPSSMRILKIPGVRYIPIQDENAVSTLLLVLRKDRARRPGLQEIVRTLHDEHGIT